MKRYDLIAVGSGSAMNIVEPYLQRYPDSRVAVIDKDDPGGICLTRGCIPSKILLYPAELLHTIHPALSEVVARAFGEPMSVPEYHHLLAHIFGAEDGEEDHREHHDHDSP
jgi:pyruvate/2-oxoglutarate dehydrogenase complex dihydrolipoamide dehydrogenase (E3) component